MEKVNGVDLAAEAAAKAGPVCVGRIVIEMFNDGSITANGPNDMVMFYGMMEIGKDIIRENVAKQRAQQGIQVARAIPPSNLLNKIMQPFKRN